LRYSFLQLQYSHDQSRHCLYCFVCRSDDRFGVNPSDSAGVSSGPNHGSLGAKRGGLAMLLFLLLVAIGLPQASGGSGLGVFFGPRGGFLLAFPLGAFTVGWLTEQFWQRLNFGIALLANVLGGISVVYAVGLPWLAFLAGGQTAIAAVAFLPGDLAKAVIAALVTVTVRRTYPLLPTR
jgi:biotin transport system substrate-specific component